MRARQAKEDLAAQQLAEARREADRAVREHAEQTVRVTGMSQPEQAGVQAFHAAAAARHAAAATLAASQHRIVFAEARVANGRSGLEAAARSRRSAEKLVERDADAEHRRTAAAGQRELDDIAITRHVAHRRAPS
jgi:flagellar export protein FliJ